MGTTYKYREYGIAPAAIPSRNLDGETGKWMPHAQISRTKENEDLVLPVDWSNEFNTKAEAEAFALEAAKHLIDSGNCAI